MALAGSEQLLATQAPRLVPGEALCGLSAIDGRLQLVCLYAASNQSQARAERLDRSFQTDAVPAHQSALLAQRSQRCRSVL